MGFCCRARAGCSARWPCSAPIGIALAVRECPEVRICGCDGCPQAAPARRGGSQPFADGRLTTLSTAWMTMGASSRSRRLSIAFRRETRFRGPDILGRHAEGLCYGTCGGWKCAVLSCGIGSYECAIELGRAAVWLPKPRSPMGSAAPHGSVAPRLDRIGEGSLRRLRNQPQRPGTNNSAKSTARKSGSHGPTTGWVFGVVVQFVRSRPC